MHIKFPSRIVCYKVTDGFLLLGGLGMLISSSGFESAFAQRMFGAIGFFIVCWAAFRVYEYGKYKKLFATIFKVQPEDARKALKDPESLQIMAGVGRKYMHELIRDQTITQVEYSRRYKQVKKLMELYEIPADSVEQTEVEVPQPKRPSKSTQNPEELQDFFEQLKDWSDNDAKKVPAAKRDKRKEAR